MAVDERRRSELFQAAAQVLGQEQAVTMFELLPPPGTDVASQQAVDHRFDLVDRRFEEIDRRFEQVDQRFQQIDQRFDRLEASVRASHDDLARLFRTELAAVDARIVQMRDEAIAVSRGELMAAVSGQTRAMVVAVIAAVLGVTGLAVTIAELL
jgi:septal ring factor EnvC (AmiA/AmiB activator)